jgi:triosephosphate isomerase
MNLEYDDVYNYIDRINKIDTTNNLVICPTAIYLEAFINHCNWGVGAQNIYYEESGNYTGEVSINQIKSLGIEYAIVGHFERKKYFNEDNDIIRKKLESCLDSSIAPILCFGETGDIDTAIKDLDELLVNIPNIDFITFAYEPLEVSDKETPVLIEDDINQIYDYLYQKYKSRPNIIYGGGVAEENINNLLKIKKLNGILIGRISANIDDIEEIISNID